MVEKYFEEYSARPKSKVFLHAFYCDELGDLCGAYPCVCAFGFVVQIQGLKLEFDTPYKELSFTGVPNKTTVDVFTALLRSHFCDFL